MNKFLKNDLAKDCAVLASFAILVSCCTFSWIVTCGIVKLITMCFGWTFKWKIATGIWLIIGILKSIFKRAGI